MCSGFLGSLGALAALAAFCAAMAGVGILAFRWMGIALDDPVERLICAIGLGVVLFEVDCFLLAASGGFQGGIWWLLGACGLIAAVEASRLRSLFAELWAKRRMDDLLGRVVRGAFLAAVAFEGIAAMAPLTGSDATHYHFTAAKLLLSGGFHPYFFLTNSFLIGQGHLLILTGLAIGSEKFAMGLLWLGGVLAALAAACVAQRWMPATGAWLVALTFVLTPAVFWQMSTAGTPDLWIAFFAVAGVLMVERAGREGQWNVAAVAGVFAGAAAGGKYTGCVVAASLGVALVWQRRNWRVLVPFGVAAVLAGVWPYLRNWAWTGDPVFPLLMTRLEHAHVNAHALAAFLAESGASRRQAAVDVIRYPFFAAIDPANLGFWQFLGPVCFGLAPLLLFGVKKTNLWRVLLTVWIMSAVIIGKMTGMLRFTLPLYPLGLAAVFAGLSGMPQRSWSWVRGLAWGTLTIFLFMGAGGLLMYGRRAVMAGLGITPREKYLERIAPDYPKTRFVNEALRGRDREGKTLVFFRHVYYLNVPFVYGNPDASWAVDPEKLRDAVAWQEWMRERGIRWVVKAPSYPAPIRGPLEEMERAGEMVPVAETSVDDFVGNRLLGVRAQIPVVIMEVREAARIAR
jgi:hypothetical protein